MKKVFCNYRYYVLLALFSMAVVMLCAESETNDFVTFAFKLLSFVFATSGGFLLVRWDVSGKIPELSDFLGSEY